MTLKTKALGGIEPPTPGLQDQCSSHWAKEPLPLCMVVTTILMILYTRTVYVSVRANFQYLCLQCHCTWGYSSVVEHSTADREVPGSNPGVPSCFAMCTFRVFVLLFCIISYRLRQLKVIVYFSESARTVAMGRCEGLEMVRFRVFRRCAGIWILDLHVTPSEQHMWVWLQNESKSASAGNRTRVTRVAGENSTTEPPMLHFHL